MVDSGFPAINPKERYWLPELEVVLDVGISSTHQLYSQLVQRVVVALAELDGPPGITSLDSPLYTRLLGLLAESFLLGLVFQL